MPPPNSQVKNSFIFKDIISKMKIPTDHIMISLDVSSLFTSVPFDLIINSINKRWNLIKSATNLPLEEFKKGIEFLMNNTFFQFDNKYYQQIFGTPMGSPISPMLADLVLQDLEEVVLNKLSFKIHTYYRYFDDTFLIIPKNMIKDILENFNSYHSRLKFTHEIEFENTLSFLNLLMIKKEDGIIETNWHRKNTFSGKYLNYFSNHPLQQKIAIIKNLVDTAILLSHEKFHDENLEIIKNLLMLNSYPENFIKKHIKNRIFQLKNKDRNSFFIPKNNEREIDYKRVISIPYYGNLSCKLKRQLKKYNITTVFRNITKLDKYIKLGKDPLNKSDISNVVYKIPCLDCSKTYVGQTGRMLCVRCDEHKKNINLNEKYHNVVTKHRINNKNDTGFQHNFDWDNIEILHKETNYFKRIIAEMFYIKKEGNNSINVMSDLKDYNTSYDIILDHLT